MFWNGTERNFWTAPFLGWTGPYFLGTDPYLERTDPARNGNSLVFVLIVFFVFNALSGTRPPILMYWYILEIESMLSPPLEHFQPYLPLTPRTPIFLL